MDTLNRESPAKINLTLRIVGKRPDGFHEIESLVARVDFCDQVRVASQDNGYYALDCDDPALPRDGSNLVLRAARALSTAAGVNHGADIFLKKRIPSGAGLGGGSSNAATTLELLNELWECGLSKSELSQIAAGLGSDVPLFLHAPLVIVRGRGERIEELTRTPALWSVLVLPELRCATPATYAAWDQLDEHPPRPPIEDIVAALGSAEATMDLLFNDLQPAAVAVVPELGRLIERVSEVGGRPISMTGSGAGLFRLFDERPAADGFAKAIAAEVGVRTVVAALLGS